MIYRRRGKRLLDVCVSFVALAFLSPLVLVGWAAVRLTSPGPGFFHQTRIGRGEKPFCVRKIRTMPLDPNRVLAQTTNKDPDVLPVGRVLRRLKIDELPQLLNVLFGDMSIIGPRPCVPATLEEMPDWARRRFELRPGLTGLAQVNGNVALTWEERWRHDVAYVDRWSFWLDMKIILKTIPVIWMGEENFRRPA